MQLDSTAKVVSIVSVVVGVFVSLAGWYTGNRIQSAQADLGKLIKEEKQVNVDKGHMELQKSMYDESARLSAEFSVPLARSFAVQYRRYLDAKDQSPERYVVPAGLSGEITAMWPTWEKRVGLMTGQACEPEGLLARQIIVLVLKNLGRVDAVDVVLTAMEKRSPAGEPSRAWHERGPAGALSYDALLSAQGWARRELPLPDLHGTGAPAAERRPYKVVLASVSGRTTLYGTVFVPVEIAWSDRVTKQRQKQALIEPHAAALNADLSGAEIGRVGSLCAKPKIG
jgi:hypothetical protein